MFNKKKQEESGNLESTTPKNTLSNDPAVSALLYRLPKTTTENKTIMRPLLTRLER